MTLRALGSIHQHVESGCPFYFSLSSDTKSVEKTIMKIAVRAEQDTESLATFVHGVLADLPALGIVYNIKRHNFPQSRSVGMTPSAGNARDLAHRHWADKSTSAEQWIFSTFPGPSLDITRG